MTDNIRVRRYAQAVFSIATDSKDFNKWLSDLRKITSLTREDVVFALLENPEVSFNDKAKLLSNRLSGINPRALKLVSHLVYRGRLDIIGDITDEYQQLLDDYHGIEGAGIIEVTTAIPLDDEDRIRIAQRLTDILSKPIALKYEVDSSLIGGIIIRIGDQRINGSIRSKLEALRKNLSEIER
ncbi:ATP synthase F1 subunit delta [Chloroflexota bacterium]